MPFLEPPWLCTCGAVVKIDEPYFEGPCGTYCSFCMKQHVKKCINCAQKFPEAVTPRFGCPRCNSEEVSENNIVQVRFQVAEWDANGEPVDFCSRRDEIADTIRCVTEDEASRFHCRNCGAEFEMPERIER